MNWRGSRVRNARKDAAWQQPAAVVAETDGRRCVDFEVGARSENTFQLRYARLPEAQLYCSDRYSVYAARFPLDCHRASQGGLVHWNEGLHSVLRSKLNRPARRTKGYAKSVEMLRVYSVVLVCQRMEAKSIIPVC